MPAGVLPGMERMNRVLSGPVAVTTKDQIGTTAPGMIVIAVVIAMNKGRGPDLDHGSEIPTATDLIAGEVHPAPGAEIDVEAMSE